jgi:hypothetical protein
MNIYTDCIYFFRTTATRSPQNSKKNSTARKRNTKFNESPVFLCFDTKHTQYQLKTTHMALLSLSAEKPCKLQFQYRLEIYRKAKNLKSKIILVYY